MATTTMKRHDLGFLPAEAIEELEVTALEVRAEARCSDPKSPIFPRVFKKGGIRYTVTENDDGTFTHVWESRGGDPSDKAFPS